MSGLNPIEKLKHQGVDAKKASQALVSVYDIFIPTTGPIAHPRAGDPIEPEMVSDVKANGVIEPIIVRRDGVVDGKMRLTLVDGSRRTQAKLESIRQLEQEKAEIINVYVPVEFFTGSDLDLLKARLRKNTDPLKKPDAPSVLARTAIQLDKQGATPDEIMAVMPRHITDKAMLASLLRWDDLVLDARQRFDNGAPLGLLQKVLDAPRDEQVATLDKYVTAGVTSTKGATRLENRERGSDRSATRPMPPKQAKRVVEALSKFQEAADDGLAAFVASVAFEVATGDRSRLGELPWRLRDAIETVLSQPVKKGRG